MEPPRICKVFSIVLRAVYLKAMTRQNASTVALYNNFRRI
jgi:hypothetical protein